VESTVLDLSVDPPRILRPGGTPQERIEEVIGAVLMGTFRGEPLSPGQLKSHYAPRIPLILHHREEMLTVPYQSSEGYLFFEGSSRDAWLRGQYTLGSVLPLDRAEESRIRVLSEAGSMTEAAANLFDLLHELDKVPISAIQAERVPEEGLGMAINDRLSRAGA
jgi:L-threonylcarbamoyladenylate synthase